MADVPMPNPDAALVVAHRHQEEYERLARHTEGRMPDTREREERFHHGAMAENNALLAIAGYLKSIDDRLYYAEQRGKL